VVSLISMFLVSSYCAKKSVTGSRHGRCGPCWLYCYSRIADIRSGFEPTFFYNLWGACFLFNNLNLRVSYPFPAGLHTHTKFLFENLPNSKRNSTTLIYSREVANLRPRYLDQWGVNFSFWRARWTRHCGPPHEQKWRENEADGGKTFPFPMAGRVPRNQRGSGCLARRRRESEFRDLTSLERKGNAPRRSAKASDSDGGVRRLGLRSLRRGPRRRVRRPWPCKFPPPLLPFCSKSFPRHPCPLVAASHSWIESCTFGTLRGQLRREEAQGPGGSRRAEGGGSEASQGLYCHCVSHSVQSKNIFRVPVREHPGPCALQVPTSNRTKSSVFTAPRDVNSHHELIVI